MARRSNFGFREMASLVSGAVQFTNTLAAMGQAAENSGLTDEDLKEQIDPLAGFANGNELARYGFNPDGFYLGKIHPDHNAQFEACLPPEDDRHIFVVAGSASGKGVTYGIQNAIRWKGGLLAIDPKGEMAEITAMRRGKRQNALNTGTATRQFVGQEVAILDPMGIVRGAAKKYRVDYNPLSDINMDIKGGRRQIGKLASGMVMPEEGANAHFSENAATLLAGTIEAVKLTEKAEDHTLPFVRLKIMGVDGDPESEAGFAALYDYLTASHLPKDGHAAEAASVIGEILGSDEAGSFRTTLSRNIKWLSDPDIKNHLQASNFSLWKAIQNNWSVFIVLKPDDLDDFKNWLRMVTQIALSAKMALGTNQKGLQTLFFLDEFAALGKFSEIEAAAGYMRGYGIKLVPIIQNIGQIKKLYARNWETFLGNAGAIIAWGLNDLETEQYISDRLGKIIVSENSLSFSANTNGIMGSNGYNRNKSLRERAVRFSNEIHEQGARETMRAFVIPASGKGFMVERVPYMALAKHKIFDSPDHVIELERQKRKARHE